MSGAAVSGAAVSGARRTSCARRRQDGWSVTVLLLALLFALPILVVVATVLRDYVTNTLLLMVGVGLLTLVIGVSTAWLTAMCRFPGRRIFQWALLLPMAMPAYIIAYT